MNYYDVYSKCTECGSENWWEVSDNIYDIGDYDVDFCRKCKKQTVFEVTEIKEYEEGDYADDT